MDAVVEAVWTVHKVNAFHEPMASAIDQDPTIVESWHRW
jgi:hypothetical protein